MDGRADRERNILKPFGFFLGLTFQKAVRVNYKDRQKYICYEGQLTLKFFLESVAKKFDIPTLDLKVYDESKTGVDKEVFEFLVKRQDLGVLEICLPQGPNLDVWDQAICIQGHLDSITGSLQPYLHVVGDQMSVIHKYFIVIDKYAIPCEIIFDRSASNITHDGERSHRRLTFEEAVEETGFGLFHWLLLVVCGWANASDAVEILCVSFLLPTARCDLLLSSSDKGLLTASIFLGMMVGGYTWGYLADQRGRRKVLVVSLTVNGLFGGLASMAPWFWLFLLLRFISGVGVGGSIPVIFSYFSEFMPRLRRGAMISALATFWMAGNILAAGLAWLVIPTTWAHFYLGGLNFQSWRVFVVLCSVPSLTSALLFKLIMPESPKFLMEAGREKEAILVFRLMFELNMSKEGKVLPEFGLCTSSKQRGKLDEPKSSRKGRLGSIVKKGLLPIKQMFDGQLKSRSIVLLIVFYCISFGYYGLWMWLPELFARMEDGGSPCANMSRPSPLNDESCSSVKTAVYMEGFIVAACNLPGNIFTILMMDSTGGKALLSFSLVVSSLSVFLIYVVQTKGQSLFLSCVFSGVTVIAWNALDVVGTELYPTHLRSSALGFFTGVGRVAAIMGNVVFGNLVDTNCAVPILLVSTLLLTGGLVALLLPQTRQTELT